MGLQDNHSVLGRGNAGTRLPLGTLSVPIRPVAVRIALEAAIPTLLDEPVAGIGVGRQVGHTGQLERAGG